MKEYEELQAIIDKQAKEIEALKAEYTEEIEESRSIIAEKEEEIEDLKAENSALREEREQLISKLKIYSLNREAIKMGDKILIEYGLGEYCKGTGVDPVITLRHTSTPKCPVCHGQRSVIKREIREGLLAHQPSLSGIHHKED